MINIDDIPKSLNHGRTDKEMIECKKNLHEYISKFRKSTEVIYAPIKLDVLKRQFKETFEQLNSEELILNEHNSPIFDLMCRYFTKDSSFTDSDIVMNTPSLNKGLLIIGKYGCGKTAMMETFHEIGRLLMPNKYLWFVSISTLELIDEYESQNNTSKEQFFKKYNDVKTIYFDDFGTEEDASNYGKKNLLKEIIEKRYMKKNKTFLTTNLSLIEIKEKYGNRVFSRLQEMFNIIQFPGDDMRR